jgi:hypothetical protein
MDRKTQFLWMKDVLEHLGDSFEEWRRSDSHDERYLAEAVQRDLEEFQRLCKSMKQANRSSAPRREAVLV